ncbi:hypothetical protein [Actinoplanes sp. NBRC 103695]|uniref:hypothetical protein n=1 Tax=Actinoplanes sp. NBRC 103695 TaxID=3032202 RepID=UPI0024A23085|nr:hypothetical protein [Actinoplanes sp. NBRC 103695]GLY98513.1 hypothetical protein Acsp02_57670 [Actinoplanes sp. NBRC 103695]
MGRIVYRTLVVIAASVLAGCGSDKAPTPLPPPPAPIFPSTSESDDPFGGPDPSAQVTEEEDVEPSADPGDLSDQAQAYLDEAVGTELGALAEAGERRPALEKLPDDPSKVLAALKDYTWLSPQAKALYEKAVSSS